MDFESLRADEEVDVSRGARMPVRSDRETADESVTNPDRRKLERSRAHRGEHPIGYDVVEEPQVRVFGFTRRAPRIDRCRANIADSMYVCGRFRKRAYRAFLGA